MKTAYLSLVSWLEHNMLSCPSKQLLIIDCPGCGLQRGTIALLKGDFSASWQVYPPTAFLLATLLFLCFHLVFKWQYGTVILKYLYIVTAIVMLVNYIYKIFTNQLV